MNERTNLVPGRSNLVSLPMATEDEKKTYRAPRLVEYGDFHRLTQSGTGGGFGAEDASLGTPTVT